MQKKRQQYCTASGGVVLMFFGVILNAGWQLICSSPAMRLVQANICGALLTAGCLSAVVGTIGTALACFGGRSGLFAYAFATLVLGCICGLGSLSLLAEVSSETTLIDLTCVKVQRQLPQAEISTDFPLQVQAAYDSMRSSLSECRNTNPQALRLDACSKNQSASTSNDENFKAVFRWAEDEYACGGFCQDGLPLFALPVGSVTEATKLRNRSACFAPLVQEARSRSSVACGLLATFSFAALAPALCACWLACAPPPAARTGGYVHRPEELEWNLVPQQDEEDDEQSQEYANSYREAPDDFKALE